MHSLACMHATQLHSDDDLYQTITKTRLENTARNWNALVILQFLVSY